MRNHVCIFFVISILVVLLCSCTNKSSNKEVTSQNNISNEISLKLHDSGLDDQGMSPTPPSASSDDTGINWSYEQLLDENDVNLDGFSYDILTSDQVLMLFTRLLSNGDEQRLNVLISESLLGKWGINNTLFHGITPQTISEVKMKESTYRPLPEPHDVFNTDSDARYELTFNQGINGFFVAQPEKVTLFIDKILFISIKQFRIK
ncbi:MAG: hypothetical protein ACYDEX_15135 [Mobilitalea sp.]